MTGTGPPPCSLWGDGHLMPNKEQPGLPQGWARPIFIPSSHPREQHTTQRKLA